MRSPLPISFVRELGVVIVGDFALATGADRHLPFVARELAAESGARIAWVWLVPADPVAVAAALHDAWLRPQPVACFGGLGEGHDDYVRAALSALQTGLAEVGQPLRPVVQRDDLLSAGNIAFFSGHPARAHPQFHGWWRSNAEAGSVGGGIETLPWPLPESANQQAARSTVARAHPLVLQHIGASSDGTTRLAFTAPSRGKAQAARKALQRLMADGTSG